MKYKQMTIFDFGLGTYGDRMRSEGWVNVYDRMPARPGKYLVENHEGQRGYERAVISFGRMAWVTGRWNAYDTCWWKHPQEDD